MNNKERVHRYLAEGKTLTAFDGFTKLGIVSVRDYISMLRADGMPIASEWRENLTTGKRWKEYFMAPAVK